MATNSSCLFAESVLPVLQASIKSRWKGLVPPGASDNVGVSGAMVQYSILGGRFWVFLRQDYAERLMPTTRGSLAETQQDRQYAYSKRGR